ncbi:SRPBCC family protein [Paraflavitalea pollutisoli]|uniref:SRPBCC family protein n=1 Tax=Paraflavitalea pollutisoli TaxID=3034143 RepID=UPI0023ED5C7F|nr:SRPBCC family protein [Paraflavitalea sp. H1-2-19X]
MSQTQPVRRTDRRSRLIKASPAVIYQALLDPEALATWRAPTGMKGRIDHFEAKEGGNYKMTLTYEDTSQGVKGKSSEQDDSFEGRFVQLAPNEKVVEETEFDSEDPAFAGTMRITTSLQETEEGTEVTMTCENVPPGIREEDHLQGIDSSLENLAAYTEKL